MVIYIYISNLWRGYCTVSKVYYIPEIVPLWPPIRTYIIYWVSIICPVYLNHLFYVNSTIMLYLKRCAVGKQIYNPVLTSWPANALVFLVLNDSSTAPSVAFRSNMRTYKLNKYICLYVCVNFHGVRSNCVEIVTLILSYPGILSYPILCNIL